MSMASSSVRVPSARRTTSRDSYHSATDDSVGGTTSTVFVSAEVLSKHINTWSDLTLEEFEAAELQATAATSASSAADEEAPEEVHIKTISKTKLLKGNSLVVDLGSRINIIGIETVKEFTDIAKASGQEVMYVQRKRRLHVNGVGSDSATCDREIIAPIAVKFEEQPATKEQFRANIAEGCGASLPAILGADSMQEKDAVLILRKGKEFIAFPGPGGYQIKWSPGTKLLPMIPTPSGHLVIPCDRFAELPTANAQEEQQLTFWTDHRK